MASKTIFNLVFFISLFVFTNCSVNYGFKGGSTPPSAKNLAIPNVLNESIGGPANLGQLVTEQLREYFQRNTKLEIVIDNAYEDLVIEGNIVSYQITSMAPVANNNGVGEAAQNELVMTFKGKYFNPHAEEGKQEIPIEAKGTAAYKTSQNLTDVELQLIEECVNEILIEIYSKTFDNW